MSPLSGPVLGAAALVSAPAWWASLVAGTETLDHAVVRFLVAVVACWAALSIVVDTAFHTPATARRPAEDPPPQPDEATVPPESAE